MTTIDGVGTNLWMTAHYMHSMKRADPTAAAEQLFSKLDTSGQGYIEKSDLAAALDRISSSTPASDTTSNSLSIDELFAKLDGNGDGKITEQELADSLKQIAERLESQFKAMHLNAGADGPGAMPPSPPPADEAKEANGGFTKDELTSQLQALGTSDSHRAAFISNIVDNFADADANGDGKVSFEEARAYSRASGSDAASFAGAAVAGREDTSAKVMLQIVRLMQAYNIGGDTGSAPASQLSVSA